MNHTLCELELLSYLQTAELFEQLLVRRELFLICYYLYVMCPGCGLIIFQLF